jgi:hypothetical protein
MTFPRITTLNILGAAVLSVSVASCSAPDHANSTQSPPSSTVSRQSSPSPGPPLPADFPDLSGFTESIGQFDQVNVPRVQGFYFSTPSGLICGSNAYPEVQFEYVGCRGPVPSQGPGDWAVRARYGESETIESIADDPDFAADKQSPPPLMAPMHKVSASNGDAVCGVVDVGTVACRVDDHGFVITPTSAEVF